MAQGGPPTQGDDQQQKRYQQQWMGTVGEQGMGREGRGLGTALVQQTEVSDAAASVTVLKGAPVPLPATYCHCPGCAALIRQRPFDQPTGVQSIYPTTKAQMKVSPSLGLAHRSLV